VESNPVKQELVVSEVKKPELTQAAVQLEAKSTKEFVNEEKSSKHEPTLVPDANIDSQKLAQKTDSAKEKTPQNQNQDDEIDAQ